MQKLLLKSTLSLPESEREEILQYMTREDDQLLIGLELLKVESQQETWVKFSSDSSSLIFLETTEFSKSLLPCTRETFMAACSLSDPMYNILANIARRGGYCLSWSLFMFTPLCRLIFWLFPASAIQRYSIHLFPFSIRKCIYSIFTWFGMGIYLANSLYGIYFDLPSSITSGLFPVIFCTKGNWVSTYFWNLSS